VAVSAADPDVPIQRLGRLRSDTNGARDPALPQYVQDPVVQVDVVGQLQPRELPQTETGRDEGPDDRGVAPVGIPWSWA
jgi:hypothetical protein